ncbi:MAG TPA: hypothetical protein VF658_14450 [Pyrinomonadaceae bacterium]|jgi:hypothetical protein
MHKKYLSVLLALLVANVLIGAPTLAGPRLKTQAQTVEQIKIKVAKLGVGEKARATVQLKDGTKIKGYITEARDGEFVIRDRQTNEPRTVSYRDVVKIEKSGGHSTARNIAIGVAVGVGAVLAVLGIIISHLD